MFLYCLYFTACRGYSIYTVCTYLLKNYTLHQWSHKFVSEVTVITAVLSQLHTLICSAYVQFGAHKKALTFILWIRRVCMYVTNLAVSAMGYETWLLTPLQAEHRIVIWFYDRHLGLCSQRGKELVIANTGSGRFATERLYHEPIYYILYLER